MSKQDDIVQEILNRIMEIRKTNFTYIINGLYYKELYKEYVKDIGDYILSLPPEFKENFKLTGEGLYFFYVYYVLNFQVEVSITSDKKNYKKREVAVFDTGSNSTIYLEIDDYSMEDIIYQNKFSHKSLRRIKNAVKELYEMRGNEDIDLSTEYVYNKDGFFKLAYITEYYDLLLDPYKHDIDDEVEDEDVLSSSYGEDEEGKDSDLSIRWQDSLNKIYAHASEMMVKDFVQKYENEINSGLNFDEIYAEFISKFREIENAHQPLDKKSREKPIDVFLYFCDYVFNIDVGCMKFNEARGLQKRIGADRGYSLIIDNHLFKDASGTYLYHSVSLENVIDLVRFAPMNNAQVLYDSVKEIYLKRKNR